MIYCQKLCIALFVLGLPLQASSVEAGVIIDWTNRAASGFDSAKTAVIDHAISLWESKDINFLGASNPYDIAITQIDNMNVGSAFSEWDSQAIPFQGRIGIDTGMHPDVLARGGFFVDPTPGESSEFIQDAAFANHFLAKAGGPAEGKIDFLTVILHELGHALGLEETPRWHFAAVDANGDRINQLDYNTGIATLSPLSRAHLDQNTHPFDLMVSSLDPNYALHGTGDRRGITQLNVDILNGLYGGPPASQAGTVPEPTSLATWGLMIFVGSGFAHRRRRRLGVREAA